MLNRFKENQVTHANTRQDQHPKRPHEEPPPRTEQRWKERGIPKIAHSISPVFFISPFFYFVAGRYTVRWTPLCATLCVCAFDDATRYESIYLYLYLYIYICMHEYTYIYIYRYTSIYVYMYIYICVCISLSIYRERYIHIYRYRYRYIYTCIYTYTYIYIFTHIYIHLNIYIYICI